MPLAIITAKPGLIGEEEEKELGLHLQRVIAEALDAPDDEGGKLTADEIEIRFQDVSPRTINASPFAVEIFANDYPSRRNNLEYRLWRIIRELRGHGAVPTEVIDGMGGFVWIFLGTAAFGKL